MMVGLGCRQPTEILLDITSDALECQAPSDLQFASLSVVASSSQQGLIEEPASAVSTTCTPRAHDVSLGSIALVPRADHDHAEVLVVAGVILHNADGSVLQGDDQSCLAAYRDFLSHPESHCQDHCDPCLVATRNVGFVSHQELRLAVDLTAVCKGVFCAAGKTCGADGSCVSSNSTCNKGLCDLGGAGGAGSSSTAEASVTASEVSASASSGGGGGILQLTQVLGASGPLPQVNGITGIVTVDSVAVATDVGIFSCQNAGCVATQQTTHRFDSISTPDGAAYVAMSEGTAQVASDLMGNWTQYSCGSPIVDAHRSGLETFVTGNPDVPYYELVRGIDYCDGKPSTLIPTRAWGFAPSKTNALDEMWIMSSGQISYARINQAVIADTAFRKLLDLWGYDNDSDRSMFFADALHGLVLRAYIDHNTSAHFETFPLAASVTGTTAVGGMPNADGSVDLWLATRPPGISGVVVQAPPGAAGPSTNFVPLGLGDASLRNIFVTNGFIWVGTDIGLFVAPRPVL